MNKSIFLIFFLLMVSMFNSYAKPPTASEVKKEMAEDRAIHKIASMVFLRTYNEMSYNWNVAAINNYCGKVDIFKAISRRVNVKNLLMLEVNRHKVTNDIQKNVLNNLKHRKKIVSRAEGWAYGHRFGYERALEILDSVPDFKSVYCSEALKWANGILDKEQKVPKVFKHYNFRDAKDVSKSEVIKGLLEK